MLVGLAVAILLTAGSWTTVTARAPQDVKKQEKDPAKAAGAEHPVVGAAINAANPKDVQSLDAIVAAIYLDGGFDDDKVHVLRTMEPKIELIARNAHQQNYKALLQQHAQKSMNATPVYELLDEKGPDHSKCFEVCVQIDGKRFESAWGPNKKMAEQKAALLALEELGLMDSEDIDDAMEDIAEEEPAEEDK